MLKNVVYRTVYSAERRSMVEDRCNLDQFGHKLVKIEKMAIAFIFVKYLMNF